MKLEILDLFEPGEWEWLKQDMLNRIGPKGVDREYSAEFAEMIWGVKGRDVIDRRVVLKPGTPSYQLVSDILNRHFHGSQGFYIAYQRQMIPHGLHVDLGYDPGESSDGYSLIIPLMEAPEFKLFVWNRPMQSQSDVGILKNAIRKNTEEFPVIDNISQRFQLRHCNEFLPVPLSDVIEILGIYDYRVGTMAKFPRNYLHASHDWLSSGLHQYKDFILVHTNPLLEDHQ